MFGLYPVFYQFTSVILYTCTMSSRSCHGDLLDSQKDTGDTGALEPSFQLLLKPSGTSNMLNLSPRNGASLHFFDFCMLGGVI